MITTHLVMFFFDGAGEAVAQVEDVTGGGWLSPEQAASIRKRLQSLRDAQDRSRDDRIAAREAFRASIRQTLDIAIDGEPDEVRQVAKAVEAEAAKALTIDPVIDMTPIIEQLRQIEEALRLREQQRRDDEVITILLLAA